MQNALSALPASGSPLVSNPSPELQDLCTPEVFQAENPDLYPSPISFRWALRQHRPFLAQCGALVEIAGRILVVRPRMGPALLEIGKRAMQSARGRDKSAAAKDCV